MFNARSIQGILFLFASLFLAVWLGISIVNNQLETLIQVSACALLIITVLLGRRVWLIMTFFSAANVVLVSGFGTVQIGQCLFIGMTFLIFLMRKLRFKIKIQELEIWMLLIVACIVQVYLRNPVGLNVFGGSAIGGKPYVFLILSIISAFVLSTLIINPKDLKWAYRLSILGSLIGIGGSVARSGSISGGSETELARIPTLATFGQSLSNWLSSRISPLRAALHPFWAAILLISLAAAAGSAYRNAVAGIALTYLFAIAFHGGIKSVILALVAGSLAIVMLAFINLNFPLPGNIQRALSPLPGTWEKQYVDSADESTEWRVEMWKEALYTERWIQNKIIGDGIGMTSAQLQQGKMISDKNKGISAYGLLVQQENMLINGSYHSGPVHSVRAVGYIGLIILVLAMIRVAVHASRQIQRCKGTEWHAVTLLFGIPLMVLPIFFCFVFGEYHSGVSTTMMGFAMIRLFEKNIPLPAWQPRKRYLPGSANLATRNHRPASVADV
jgi:hypothetical protein